MALAVTARFNFRDAKGRTSSTAVRLPTGNTTSQYVEFAQSIAQTIARFSNATMTSVSLCFGVDLSPYVLKVAAATIADVAQKLYLRLASAVSGVWKRLNIPTLDESLVVANSDRISLANNKILDLTTALTDGIQLTAGNTVIPVTARGDDITAALEAREVFRKFG